MNWLHIYIWLAVRESLGVVDKVHQPIFHAIHKERRTLNTKRAMRDLFVKHGVSGEKFDNTFDSFLVQSKLQRAKSMTRRYGVQAVPSMVVNGKYTTDSRMASINDPRGPRNENMFKVVEFLIQRETAAQAAASSKQSALSSAP